MSDESNELYRVFLEYLDPQGVPYLNMRMESAASPTDAIDRALTYVDTAPGWSINTAYAVPDTYVSQTVQIEPVPAPTYRRRVR